MPAKRRSMSDLLREQKAIEDASNEAAAASPSDVPAPRAARSDDVPAVFSAAAVPDPHSPTGAGHLTSGEKADLRACEFALDNLRLAFAAAGKALATIRDARLYRDSYDTFETYVEQRWHMSRAQAYRLIDAWPLAARLSPIGENLTESQVRELLPLAGQHGEEAAVVVYRTVAETDGVRLTAAVLHDVVGALGAAGVEPETAADWIRAYLAGEHERPQPPSVNPVQEITSVSDRFVAKLSRFAESDPQAVRAAVSRIRAALDEVERGLP